MGFLEDLGLGEILASLQLFLVEQEVRLPVLAHVAIVVLLPVRLVEGLERETAAEDDDLPNGGFLVFRIGHRCSPRP